MRHSTDDSDDEKNRLAVGEQSQHPCMSLYALLGAQRPTNQVLSKLDLSPHLPLRPIA